VTSTVSRARIRCDGCKHNAYSAPGGQAHNRAPHSRCRFFSRDIPMIVEKRKTASGSVEAMWIQSDVPVGCPGIASK